tara:strand:+ start:504 stop:707 length:204 start_codon:yes stop_codon:yes gene_type:complete
MQFFQGLLAFRLNESGGYPGARWRTEGKISDYDARTQHRFARAGTLPKEILDTKERHFCTQCATIRL